MISLKNAIYFEKLEEIKEILKNDPSSINTKDEENVWMALLVAKTGNIKMVKYIVEYSMASMNIKDEHLRNMLHYAALSGNVDTCKYLVEKVGISPLSGDINLRTPFEIAHDNKYFDLEDYFKSVVGTGLENMYHNPIRTGFFPDPSVVRVGDTYYMVNSSFIYYPCIPVSMSKDLIHWKIIGYAITNPEWTGLEELEGGRGYWAPDISYYEGKFYITATYRLNDTGNVYRKQIIVSSDKPEGPYSEPAIIDEDGIDPSIFNDDDGKRYMLLNRGARIFELNSEATKKISEPVMLFYGDNKRAPEGPHLLKKDGYYYLFQAEGGTGPGHRITVSRSRELMGKYEVCPYNPIMRQMDEDAVIQRCGHGKPIQTQNGQWYMVYLCGRKTKEGYSMLGRETALDPITWTLDGWPIVNNLDGPSVLQIKPLLPEMKWEQEDEDDFDKEYLSSDWTFPRVPEMDGIEFKDSFVRIKGSKEDLNSMYAKNIMLKRQKNFRFSVETKMKTPLLYPGQNAGITAYYDENTFLKFAVFATEEENVRLILKVSEYVDGMITDSNEIEIDYNQPFIYLKMEVNGLKRSFYYSYDGKDFNNAAKLDNVYYLSDEGIQKGKRFTGAMVGLYAYDGNYGLEYKDEYGNCGEENIYAEFDYFKYIEE